MTFRARFLTFFSIAVLASSGLLMWGGVRLARQEFERIDRERSAALTEQFQRELQQRGEEVRSAMQELADAEATMRMAIDLGRPQADPSVYANDGRGLATAHRLDFLDVLAGDGTLISSAHWPARAGYRNNWVTSEQDWNQRGAFLQRIDLPDGEALGMMVVRVVAVGGKSLYFIGGRRVDRAFLRSVALPAGTRAILYRNLESTFQPDALESADGPVDQPERFSGLIESAQKSASPSNGTIQWAADRDNTESFVAIPLTGRETEPLGVILVGSMQRELPALINSILLTALVLGALGILFGIFLSSWVSARFGKPLEQLNKAVQQVLAGNWGARADVRSRDEAGQLAESFNEMTSHLSQERARLIQTERVAAWRDVAQRVTHDVKQSLFPLEVTVSGLLRARVESPHRLGEAVAESLPALRGELDQLKASVTRFSDFAKMPQPRCKPLDVNELLRSVLQSFEPQFRATGRPPITPELFLDTRLGRIQGDADLLRKAFENLLLHSIDTMPSGGTLTVRTGTSNGNVHIQISGTGPGFGAEKSPHPFSAFRARQAPGSGLGLPTTQAVVSDHGGRFYAETVPGVGTTFWLEFALTTQAPAPAPPHAEAPKREIRRDLADARERVTAVSPPSLPQQSPAESSPKPE